MKKLIIMYAILLSCSPVMAHSIYVGLNSKEGYPCCGDNDCASVEYRVVPGGYEFHLTPDLKSVHDEAWLFLPSDKVEVRLIPNDTSKSMAHWCGFQNINGASHYIPGYHTYCAFVPPGTS